jgi:hypothetical protein
MLTQQPSAAYQKLARASNAELEAVFLAAATPALEALAGWEFRGFNTPFFARLLGIQKFIKGFFQEPGNELAGYNVPVHQNGLEAPWVHKPSAEMPKRFGYYQVYRVRAGERDHRYPHALLLNYGASRRNKAYQVERVLRDYLVQPDAANPDLLLGKAYLAFGPLRVPSNFFILERLRKAP